MAFGVPDAARDGKQLHRRHHDGRRGRRLGRDHAGDQGHAPAHARRPRRCSPISSRSRSRCSRSACWLMGERMTAMPSAWSLGWLAYQTFWVVSLTYAVWFAMVQRYSASRLSAFTFLTPIVRRRVRPFRARGTDFVGLRAGGRAGGGRPGAGEPAELTVPSPREVPQKRTKLTETPGLALIRRPQELVHDPVRCARSSGASPFPCTSAR